MIQCLRITLTLEKIPKNFLQDVVRHHAHNLHLEGTGQMADETTVKIVVCGNRNDVDSFIDAVHHAAAEHLINPMEMEPFIRQKDYRGVFRIIE